MNLLFAHQNISWNKKRYLIKNQKFFCFDDKKIIFPKCCDTKLTVMKKGTSASRD